MTINTSKPFTRRQALRARITDDQLCGATYRRLYQGVYVGSATPPTVTVRARAALLVVPAGSYVSHHTAARIWCGWAPGTTETHVSTAAEGRSRRRGIAVHRAPEDAAPIQRNGLPISRPTQVFVELAAAGVGLVDLVVLGDSLVRAGVVTPEELITATASWTGPGCRRGRRAAGYVRKGVDSVMESRLRMLIVLAGLPEPTVNLVLRDEYGEWLARIEVCYPGLLLAIEYEGRQHAENTKQRRRDIRRREWLEGQGWRFILITAADIFEHPEDALDRIRTALRERGDAAGRGRAPAEWFRCFPGRDAA